MAGGSPVNGADGYFYQPTLVTGVSEGVRLVDEEQFGPVVPIMKYSTDEEAVRVPCRIEPWFSCYCVRFLVIYGVTNITSRYGVTNITSRYLTCATSSLRVISLAKFRSIAFMHYLCGSCIGV